jgi:hypothetical protein
MNQQYIVVAGFIPALPVVTMLHGADPPAKPWRAGASHCIFLVGGYKTRPYEIEK